MKPTYYLKTIIVRDETRYKIVANYGSFRSYLLGKDFSWEQLRDFVQHDMRLVIDAPESYIRTAAQVRTFEETFGLERRLYLSPGFSMTQNLQPVQVADTPTYPLTLSAKTSRQIPCATDCGCGPSFMEDTYFEPDEVVNSPMPVQKQTMLKQPKGSLWVRLFGE